MARRKIYMKKVLVISILASFAIVACGSAEATNADVPQAQEQTQVQEQVQQTQEQEETQKEERQYDEYEYFFSTDELDLDNPDSEYNNDSTMAPDGKYCGHFELKDSINLYASKNGKAYEVGYTKPNIPVYCFNSDDEWIRLKFENEESPNDFKLIKVSDFLANSNYNEISEASNDSSEVKEKYTCDEAKILFIDTLTGAGMTNAYSKFSYNDGCISVMIPLENTYEWVEEKKNLFLEKGITYFTCPGNGYSDYAASVQLQLMDNTGKALSKEELEQLFQNDVDLEMKQRNEEEYQQYLEQQKNNN